VLRRDPGRRGMTTASLLSMPMSWLAAVVPPGHPLDYSQSMTTFLPAHAHAPAPNTCTCTCVLHLQLHLLPLPTQIPKSTCEVPAPAPASAAAQVTVHVQEETVWFSLGNTRLFPHIPRSPPALPPARSKTSIHHDTTQQPRLLERPIELSYW